MLSTGLVSSSNAKLHSFPPRILVVEDERIVALDLTMTLRRLGYRVDASVATGEEAIASARREAPHLVLMDIRLGGELDGVAAAEQIARDTGAPIIFLTAHSDDQTLQRVRSSNPYGYLLKPFRADDLRCAVEVTLHRHAFDQALSERERWLQATLDAIHDGVIATDAHERIRYLNPVAETMTGWREATAVGRLLQEVLRLRDDANASIEALDNELAKKGAIFVEAQDGQRRAVEGAAAVIHDDRERAVGCVVALRDVTECRVALNEIRRLHGSLETTVLERTRELQLANHELDAFSYSLAHDLRSPLRAIDGYAQSLLEDHRDAMDETCAAMLQKMRATAQRAARLIVDLLQLAHLTQSQMHPTPLDVSALARQIAAEQLAAQSNKTVRLTVQPDLHVVADKALLSVVVSNLLDNACKFAAGRAVPTVEFGAVHRDGKRAFFVRDNGVGFDMQDAARIFGAFERLRGEQFQGSGIGLALVDRAVRRMGGEVWAESQPDQGATFFFTLGSWADTSRAN